MDEGKNGAGNEPDAIRGSPEQTGFAGWAQRYGGFVVLLVGGLVGLWWYFFPSYSWHQKMTVEVEIAGQLYSGSSVVAMTVDGIKEPMQLDNIARRLSMRGEATVVVLPGGQYLFALLTYDAYLTGKVFHDLVGGVVSQPEEWGSEIGGVQEIREIHPKDYPLLVTFTDINDPTTVKQVDPDNLEATFGPGVSLKRITLEITDEPVTEGKVESVLGWWFAQGTDRRDPPPFHVPNDSPRGYDTVGITQFIMKSR